MEKRISTYQLYKKWLEDCGKQKSCAVRSGYFAGYRRAERDARSQTTPPRGVNPAGGA